MFKIVFYEDKNGKCELQRYLIELKRKADNGNKNARINLNKIIYVFLTIFLYLLKCPQSLIL